MVCEHLADVERELIDAGVPITFRGQAWSTNCREWVYFDCILDRDSIRSRHSFAPAVIDHVNDDPHTGLEAGFVRRTCHDGIIGLYESKPSGIKLHP